MGSASAKWAIMAPVFVPMFMLLGYSPELTQVAYRIGDSTTNIISPMMTYFALIVAFVARYEPKGGIGTVIATMLPYTDVRRRDQVHDVSPGPQHARERREEQNLPLDRGNIVEGERAEHEVECSGRQLAEIAVGHESIVAGRIDRACLGDHLRRDVDADRVEAEVTEKACRSPRSASEVESSRPANVLPDEAWNVTVREVVRAGKLEPRVRARSRVVLVYVRKRAHSSSHARLTTHEFTPPIPMLSLPL
jgi:hypothetical protein